MLRLSFPPDANLLTALCAKPAKLLPDGKWHDEVFNWTIELHVDAQGRLRLSADKCIKENLMPGDADKARQTS